MSGVKKNNGVKRSELSEQHRHLIASYQDAIIYKLRADRVVNLDLLRRLAAARRKTAST